MVVKKARIKGQKLLSRLSSLSAFGFGMGFKFQESEQQVVREVIIFLEDRRVLYVDYRLEIESEVVHSAMEIRKELTAVLMRVKPDTPAANAFNIMRTECRRFLSGPRADFRNVGDRGPQGRPGMDAGFFEALGKLRAVFGQQLAELAALYELDLSADLETILPPPIDLSGDDDLERKYWRY
jgi:hypothetical protein